MVMKAYGAALASMPRMGPARLRELLDRWPAERAWEVAGDRRVDVAVLWREYEAAGVAVHLLGTDGYPPELADNHEAPAVLFSVGDLNALDGPRVAIIGSRRCTRYGRDVAFDLGRDLARNGVHVVSGLALGIDGAAHLGVLAAGDGAASPVAVVGSGLDLGYPRAPARLSVGRGGQRARRGVPARPRPPLEPGGGRRRRAVRSAAGRAARAVALPGP